MNKFALLPIFLLLIFSTKAQDRIVNMNHDTIHCTILSISNERIRYEQKNKDGSVTGKFMPLSQVVEYTHSAQLENHSKQHKLKILKPANINENMWRLGLNIGGSTMPWYFDNVESTSEMPDYYNKLKTGFHVNANAHYMINGSLGVGAEYSFFNSSFSGSTPTSYSTSIYLMMYEKYRQYIHYLGPSVLLVQHLDAQRKFSLNESLSAGALFIRMESQSTYPSIDHYGYTDVANNSLLTGISLAAKLGLSAEYSLSRKVSVGVGGDFIWSSLKKATVESKGPNNSGSSAQNQELPNALNLSRIDYSLVLRYHF